MITYGVLVTQSLSSEAFRDESSLQTKATLSPSTVVHMIKFKVLVIFSGFVYLLLFHSVLCSFIITQENKHQTDWMSDQRTVERRRICSYRHSWSCSDLVHLTGWWKASQIIPFYLIRSEFRLITSTASPTFLQIYFKRRLS